MASLDTPHSSDLRTMVDRKMSCAARLMTMLQPLRPDQKNPSDMPRSKSYQDFTCLQKEEKKKMERIGESFDLGEFTMHDPPVDFLSKSATAGLFNSAKKCMDSLSAIGNKSNMKYAISSQDLHKDDGVCGTVSGLGDFLNGDIQELSSLTEPRLRVPLRRPKAVENTMRLVLDSSISDLKQLQAK